MAKPKISDLVTYINKALTGNDWNTNWQKIVNWLSLGTTDIKVNKIEANGIDNSGTFTQDGNIVATGVQADTIQSDNFVGNGENLENIKVADVFAYTPFSVNSAKDNFIDITDTSKLVFLVDDGTLYKPLLVTTAKGEQIKITSINDYDVSGLNGTYYIFVDEESNNGTAYLKACSIFSQSSEPTGSNGDVWFDVSNEPFICREKVSNNWFTDEYNKVPVAKVVVTGGAISSLEYMPKNQNGYEVNMASSVLGVTLEAFTSRQSGTKDTAYHDDIYPTLVTYGTTSSVSNWTFQLHISTDGDNWTPISGGYQLDGGYLNTIVIGAGLYWKFSTTSGSYTLYYSAIKGK